MVEFAVLRSEWAPADPEVLAPILQDVLGMVRYDAVRLANAAQGIVAEHLPPEQARALAERCVAAGLPAVAVPQDSMAVVGVPVLVRTVAIAPDGLGVVLGYTGPQQFFPWKSLRLLSAGVIEEVAGSTPSTKPRKRRRMGLGGRIALSAVAGPVGSLMARAIERNMNRRQQSGGGTARSTVVEMADLFLQDPATGDTVHLRLRGPDLYYGEILGEAKAGDPQLDFRQVLLRIAEFAGGAAVTESLRALVLAGEDNAAGDADDVDPEDARFASPHELAQYNVWQLQMLLAEERGGAD